MKTWLLTGCSSGFGQRLALAAAKRGDRVIATARNVKTIKEMTTSSRKHYRETNNGSQAGDPDKAIAVILQAVDADDAPLHLRSARLRARSPSESWLPSAAISTPGATSRSPPILTSPERWHELCLNVNI